MPPRSLDTLVIIGTGFMGASIGAAARAAMVAEQVIGIDSAQASEAEALGMIDRAVSSIDDIAPSSPGAATSTRIGVVVAAPISACGAIFSALEAFHQRYPLAWVTDIASSKHGVIQAARAQLHSLASRFVSSHPMAGSERQGAAAANPRLIAGARVLISPLPASDMDVAAEVESFWFALGGVPSPMPIDDHDMLLAMISHLPHALAFSLAGAISGTPMAGAAQALHGGGLRDTTRIAASSPQLWADILLDNRECLLDAWSGWLIQLRAMQHAIERNDREALVALLSEASVWRKGLQ